MDSAGLLRASHPKLGETESRYLAENKKIKHYGHYVDDLYHMHQSKEFLLNAIPQIEDFLENEVHVKVNHDKWRLLSAYDANQYLGAYVRPYYVMPQQRTINKFCKTMRELEYFLIFNEPTIEELADIRARINSYCELLSHYKFFNLRKKYLDQPAFYNYFTYVKGFSKSILRPEYGGKQVLDEWGIPFINIKNTNPTSLQQNWMKSIEVPLDIPLDERNALQLLADNYLI